MDATVRSFVYISNNKRIKEKNREICRIDWLIVISTFNFKLK